ncbi:MAG: RHS repeat-associated core domain-containing protein [Caldilineaceae bacterium]
MRKLTTNLQRYLCLLLVVNLLLTACMTPAFAVALPPVAQQQPADDDGATEKLYLPLVARDGTPQALTPTATATVTGVPTATPTATPTSAPTLQLTPVGNQIAPLGRTLKLALAVSNPNGGALTYSVAPLPLPANAAFNPSTGEFSFKPDLSQVGEWTLTFGVSNGQQHAAETIKINVPQPPANGPTTLSGRILDANEAAAGREVPLVGATVRLMNSTPMSTTTASDGSFHFTGIPEGEQYFEYNGSSAGSSIAAVGSYGAYRGQKAIIAHVDNAIERPIYIMKIDMAGKTDVDPNTSTVVNNPNIGVTLNIPAHTVMNDQGQPYTGPISVSPVPRGFTPASLPDNLDPSRVLTIQPMGLTFQQPAPIRFPNSDNLTPGSEVNIWSLDHEQGKFFIAGKGKVSADGQWIDTVEGGIREASWHFLLPLLLILIPAIADAAGNNNRICPAVNSGSMLHLADGCLESSIQLPGYLSLGQGRQLEFSYLSQRAWPVPILPFQATLPVRAAIPDEIHYNLRNFGGLTNDMAAPMYWDKSQLDENQDELLRGAVSVNGTNWETGIYPYSIRLTNQYGATSVSSDVNGRYPLVNEQNSALGAGWGLAGLQRIYPQADDSVLLVNGNGSSLQYRAVISASIGGWDISRGGSYALVNGSDASQLRSSLNANFPGASYIGLSTLSSESLSGVGVLYTTIAKDNFTPIAPLTQGEQKALFDFVAQGKCAILSVDHADFGAFVTKSFLDPFGMVVQGSLKEQLEIPIDNPSSSPITDGPFGVVSSISQLWTGGITNLGPYGKTLASNRLGSSLTVIEPKTIDADSGLVVVFSDENMFYDSFFARNEAIFLNSFAYCLETKKQGAHAYLSPAGDYATLFENDNSSYTRRLKDGTTYTFNAAGLQTVLLDRNGNKTQYAYDSSNRLISITDPTNQVTTFTYNGAHLQKVTDPMGRTTTFDHDDKGNLIKVTFPDGSSKQFGYDIHHLMTTETDERNKTTTRHYDDYGRLVSADLPEGVTRSTQYAQKVGLVTDPNVGTVTNPAPIMRPDEVNSTVTDGESRTTTYTFGPIQSIASILDPAGLKTTIDRDQDSNPTKYTYPSGQVINQTFDSNGNLLTVNDPTVQGTTTIGYEPLFNQPQTIQDPFGNTTTISYDDNGNPTQIVSPLNRILRMSYSGQGLPVVITDTLGTVANFGYDNKGNLDQLQWGSGAIARTATFTYTDHGYLHSMTDPLQRPFVYGYDELGRLTQETLPDNRTVRYQYDAAGNLTGLTPPDRPMHGFAYDDLGQLTAYIPPVVAGVSNPRTSYAYNKSQQMTTLTRPDGKMVKYIYDNAGRLTTIQFSRGAVSYAYDAATGQLTTIGAPENVNLGFQYQGDLLIDESWSGVLTGAVQHSYDAGYRTAAIAVNGVAVGYQYDADSAPTQAGDLSLSYQPNSGLLAGSSLGNVNDSFDYNAFAELQRYTANVGAAPLFQTSYARDALGRITTLTETITNATVVYLYGYDTAGRLATVRRNGAQIASYSYDANGNRLSGSDSSGTNNGSYDNQDRLLSYGNATYSYTANGELTSKKVTSTGSVTSYNYDEFGNLLSVKLPNNDTISYLIDGKDRRIGRKVNGVLQKGWLYENQLRPVAEVDGSGTVVSRFVYATRINVPDYMVKGGVTYRLILDHLGSMRLVVNAQSGEVVQRMDYDAWGVVTQDTNPGFQPFGFAGGLWDGQTGLVRFGARDYDAVVGRWTTKDPIGFGGSSSNLYGYVTNDPMNNLDLSGEKSLTRKTLKELGFNQLPDIYDKGLACAEGAYSGGKIGSRFGPYGTAGGAICGCAAGLAVDEYFWDRLFDEVKQSPNKLRDWYRSLPKEGIFDRLIEDWLREKGVPL